MKLLKVDSIEEVEQKFETYFGALEKKTEEVELRKSYGRYLAEDVFADLDSPSFRRSVVDGYAVRAADTFGVSNSVPVFLECIGSVRMGEASTLNIGSGQTAYVPTGGMVPEGADAMVMVEHIDKLGEEMIVINRPVAPNAHIMNVGDDFKEGEKFFSKGHRISTKDIGLLAACGKGQVSVYRKPKLSILSTGDELVEPSEKPGPCQVRDINAHALSAYAEALGAEVIDLAIIPDDKEAYRNAVLERTDKCDMVVLSGGSSAGNKDFTVQVVDSLGKPGVVTHGLNIKPGKPTIVGIFTDFGEPKTVIGLPGHPLSSIIVFHVIAGRFLRKYYFANEGTSMTIPAMITENVHAGEWRITYQLVNLKRVQGQEKPTGAESGWIAEPIRAKSGAIAQLSKADGYVVIPAGSEGVRAGETVEVVLID